MNDWHLLLREKIMQARWKTWNSVIEACSKPGIRIDTYNVTLN